MRKGEERGQCLERLGREERERYPHTKQGNDTTRHRKMPECEADVEEDIIQLQKRGAAWQKLKEDFCIWVCLPRCPLSASHWNSGQIQTPRLLTHFWKHHTPSFFPVGLEGQAWLTIERDREQEGEKGREKEERHHRGRRSVSLLATSKIKLSLSINQKTFDHLKKNLNQLNFYRNHVNSWQKLLHHLQILKTNWWFYPGWIQNILELSSQT